jgi:hypothetical protein
MTYDAFQKMRAITNLIQSTRGFVKSCLEQISKRRATLLVTEGSRKVHPLMYILYGVISGRWRSYESFQRRIDLY